MDIDIHVDTGLNIFYYFYLSKNTIKADSVNPAKLYHMHFS